MKVNWKSIPIKVSILKIDEKGIKILGLFQIKRKKKIQKRP
jgi:hypothetical protein